MTRQAHAAKCLVVMVKTGKRTKRYFLAVIPGDARVDLQGLKDIAQGTYVSFAATDTAEALSGSISGTILPVSFHPDSNSSSIQRCLNTPRSFSMPPAWTARWP